jgi:hypothetical protein
MTLDAQVASKTAYPDPDGNNGAPPIGFLQCTATATDSPFDLTRQTSGDLVDALVHSITIAPIAAFTGDLILKVRSRAGSLVLNLTHNGLPAVTHTFPGGLRCSQGFYIETTVGSGVPTASVTVTYNSIGEVN